MPIIKCKMCGGDIQLAEDKTFGTCEYCGSTMTFPRLADEQRTAAFNRGNAFRRAGEFDKALAVYERIVAEDDADAEAHWCCALCRFGIEWVEDPNTYEYVPTCHRASFDSFLEDVDYKAALEYSDGVTRRQYQRDGARINEVQRGILATSRHEKPFDVFICYKELDDATGERTRDSIDAQEIYYNLTQEGYRVFFSRITLEDKAGTEYEPYIFAALNSAKVMVVLGSKPEYFNAVWVKNEWSRYLTLMHKDRSRLLLPCYKNMDPYDLPDQLSVLMSYDMTKIGFMQDLLRGIRKVLKTDEPKPTVKEPVIIQQSAGPNVDSLLQRAFIFLEDGDWQSADEYCERVLDQAPTTALAYLGKLMVELRVSHREALGEQETPFADKNNYQRAIRYGDEALRDELESYNEAIRTRLEEKRLTGIYNEIQNAAQRARTEQEWLALAERFDSLASFRDARHQAETCRQKADTARRAADFDRACATMSAAKTADEFERTAGLFDTLSGFRDAEKRAVRCRETAGEIRRKAEEERQAEERRRAEAEERRLAEEKRRAEAEERRRQARETEKARLAETRVAGRAVSAVPTHSRKTPVIAAVLAVLLIGGGIFIWKLPEIRQEMSYKQAQKAFNAGEYEAASVLFGALGEYKDSKDHLKEAQYQQACISYEAGDYGAAIVSFGALGEYKDSEDHIKEAQYQQACLSYEAGDYSAANALFGALGEYKDSEAKRMEAAYAEADRLLAAGEYQSAITEFWKLGDYKDSAAKAYTAMKEKSDADLAGLNAAAYAKADRLSDEEDYREAYRIFVKLGDYLDSEKRAEELKIKLLEDPAAGDRVFFGAFEQDNVFSNGKEDLEWIVLDRIEDHVLLLSVYGIEFKPYHSSYRGATWENCSLRKWLNDSFLTDAFNREEQERILTTTVKAEKNPSWNTNQGNDTEDKVFLLSLGECEKYREITLDAGSLTYPTLYVKNKTSNTNHSTSGTTWWLRTSGSELGRPVYVHSSEPFSLIVNEAFSRYCSGDMMIRPALWIELPS